MIGKKINCIIKQKKSMKKRGAFFVIPFAFFTEIGRNIMVNTIVCDLIDDIVIEYDITKDCLILSKQFQNYFDVINPIHNFSQYVVENQVFDEESQIILSKILSDIRIDNDYFQLKIKIINRTRKYEKFQLKGKILREEKKIIGVLKSLKIIEQAFIDPLTKIYNRNGLEEKMTPFLENCGKENEIAFLIIDLDNFKQINDNLGHLLGDALLNEVAKILKESFPTNSIISRIGGDEFVVFFHHIKGQKQIEKEAEKLCEKIEKRFLKEEESFGLSISVGIAITKEPIRYEQLYVRADMALYQAKYNGKNQVFTYGKNSNRKNNSLTIKQDNEVIEGSLRSIQGSDDNRRYRQMKTVLCEIIDILNNIEDIKFAIKSILELIGEDLDVTRAYVNFYVKDGSHIGDCYYYSKEKEQKLPDNLPLKRDEYIKNFDENGIFFCTNVKEVNEPLRKELVRMKVDTMLQVLIKKDGEVIGTLGVNSSNKKRLWVQKEIDFIYTVSKLITNYVWQLQKELEDK